MKIYKIEIRKNKKGQIHPTDLTDKEWDILKDYLPFPAKTGRPRENDRDVMNGILYFFSTSIRWQDMPKYYPSGSTCWRRMNEFEKLGIWKDIFTDINNKILKVKKLKLLLKYQKNIYK